MNPIPVVPCRWLPGGAVVLASQTLLHAVAYGDAPVPADLRETKSQGIRRLVRAGHVALLTNLGPAERKQ